MDTVREKKNQTGKLNFLRETGRVWGGRWDNHGFLGPGPVSRPSLPAKPGTRAGHSPSQPITRGCPNSWVLLGFWGIDLCWAQHWPGFQTLFVLETFVKMVFVLLVRPWPQEQLWRWWDWLESLFPALCPLQAPCALYFPSAAPHTQLSLQPELALKARELQPFPGPGLCYLFIYLSIYLFNTVFFKHLY